jgi:hypothetical protein
LKCRRVNLRHRVTKETTKPVEPIEADPTVKEKKEELIILTDNRTTTETTETIKNREITKETDRIITIKDSAIISVMTIMEIERDNRATNNKKKLTIQKMKPKKIQMMIS